MRITDILFDAAAREFEYFGKRQLYPQETEMLRRLASVFGNATVEADFVLWAEEVPRDIDNPVRSYIGVAANRLKRVSVETEQKDDPRIVAITAFVFGLINRTPHPADIKRFLLKYSQEEIQNAFKSFAEPLDEYEQKFAIKNFFRDNGGEGVIYWLRDKMAAAKQQELNIESSAAAGIAQANAERDKRQAEMDEEERESSIFGDKPF